MRFTLTLLLTSLLVLNAWADYELFYQNGKAGVRDETGTVLIPPTFDALGWSDGSFTVVNSVTGYRRDGHWGLINLKKELVTSPDYDNLTSGGGDRVIASRWLNPYTKKFGCLDLHGAVTVPFRYEAIQILGLRAIVCVKNGLRYEWGVIDLNDKSILKIAYRDIKPIGSLRFAVQDFNMKTALFSEEGTKLTEFNIDSISSFNRGVALIYENLKVGAMNRDGEIIAAPAYRTIHVAENGTLRGQAYPVWKEIDTKNNEIRRLVADSIQRQGNGYIITLGRKQGTVSSDFKPSISARYDRLMSVDNGLHVAYNNNKAGLIRNHGSTILPFDFDSLLVQKDLVRALQIKGHEVSWSVYDTFGIKKTEKTYEQLLSYNGRYFPAKQNGFWGAIDRSGKEILPCVYDSIINSSFDLTAVKFKGYYGIIDRSDKWVVTPRRNQVKVVNDNIYFEKTDSVLFVKDLAGQIIYFTNNDLTVTKDGFLEKTPEGNVMTVSWQGISTYVSAPPTAIETERVYEESEGYRGVQRDGRFGFIDKRGRLRIANRYEGIGKFSEGLAPVKILGKWGFVNTEDRVVINPNYQQAEEFKDGVSLVKRNGAWGVIGKDGNVLLQFRYDSIQRVSDRLLLYSNGKAGVASMSGHVLIEPRFEGLRILPGDRVMVSDGKTWGVTTEDGLPVIPMIYSALCYNESTDHFIVREDGGWVQINQQALK